MEQPYVDDFLKYKKIYDDAAPNTLKNYVIDLRIFFEFTEGKFNVNNKTINNFVEYLLNEKKEKRSTINRRLSALKSYYNYLYNEEIIERNPGSKIKYLRKEPPKLKNILPQDEIFKILDKIDDVRDRALLETLYSTGIRESELSALNIQDIDFENKLITIIKAKNRKYRIIPISDEALKWIKAYLGARKDGPLFLNNKYKRLGTRGIYNICKKYFNIPPHDLRHSFGTHMIMKTNNPKAVAEMMGHSNTKVTEIYQHYNTDYLSEIYKKSGMNR